MEITRRLLLSLLAVGLAASSLSAAAQTLLATVDTGTTDISSYFAPYEEVAVRPGHAPAVRIRETAADRRGMNKTYTLAGDGGHSHFTCEKRSEGRNDEQLRTLAGCSVVFSVCPRPARLASLLASM